MFEHDFKEETLHIIKEIESNPVVSQRAISDKLGISLGKTNYLLQELIKRGFVKAQNFSRNPGKIRKIQYMLTPEGFQVKVHLVKHFLEKKEAEYNRIKKEWKLLVEGGAR